MDHQIVSTDSGSESFLQTSKRKYPLFYRIALDVLLVQASSVPCERVFSSSKETDTLRTSRSKLSPLMMEILQILKFRFHADRLDFNNEWVTREEDILIADISPNVTLDMIASRRIDKLLELIASEEGLDLLEN